MYNDGGRLLFSISAKYKITLYCNGTKNNKSINYTHRVFSATDKDKTLMTTSILE